MERQWRIAPSHSHLRHVSPRQVPTPQSLRLLHVLRNVSASPAELRLLPRAGHFFEPEPSLVRVMRRFIER